MIDLAKAGQYVSLACSVGLMPITVYTFPSAQRAVRPNVVVFILGQHTHTHTHTTASLTMKVAHFTWSVPVICSCYTELWPV